MKKRCLILFLPACLLCLAAVSRLPGNTGISSILEGELPEEFTSVEAGGFYNGGDIEPWALTEEEGEELRTWLLALSLRHRTYAPGETPAEVWSGGTSYWFCVNDGELAFTWSCIDRPYLVCGGEWYEIKSNPSPPLGLPGYYFGD